MPPLIEKLPASGGIGGGYLAATADASRIGESIPTFDNIAG